LGLLCRYNGQLPSFYSVAEHSVRVADWLIDQGYPELAFAGLLHDAAEAYIGDIVRPMKQIPAFKAVYEPIEQAVEIIIGKKFFVDIWPMHEKVKEADKAVYEWEVENIRSNKQMGLGPLVATEQFKKKFKQLKNANHLKAWTTDSEPTPTVTNYEPQGLPSDFQDSMFRVNSDSEPAFDNREVTAEYWNTHITSMFMKVYHESDITEAERVSCWDWEGVFNTLSSLLTAEDVKTMTDLREIADRG